MKIYHNPRCSKSRQTLNLLIDNDVDPEIFEYLKTPPTVEELSDIVNMLGLNPVELVRKGEAIYKEKYRGLALSDNEWIEAMVENPKLIERPIVIYGNQARLGRPPELVLELLS
jgi:arsenate reductase